MVTRVLDGVRSKVTIEDVYEQSLGMALSCGWDQSAAAVEWMVVAEKCWGIMHPVEPVVEPSPVYVAKVEVQEEPKASGVTG